MTELAFKILEDHNNKIINVKKKATKKNAAVFGELQNNNIVRATNFKDVQKDVKFQDVKPRVDTRWKKSQNAVKAGDNGKENEKNAIKITKKRTEKTHITRQELAKYDKSKPIVSTVVKTVDLQKASQNTDKVVKKTEKQTELVAQIEKKTDKLLPNVEDIDAKDVGNLMLLPEYVNDIYDYLYQLEDEQPIHANYLLAQANITPRMRSVLIDWINEAHVQFHLTVETFHMTVAMIDRYLQIAHDTARSKLQLVGVTAMFIAAKYEELFTPPLEHFCYITDDAYDRQEILQMELTMLKTLDYNLSRPLPIYFLRRFSKAAKAEPHQHSAAKYFLELVAIVHELGHHKPSEVAAASLFLALYLFNTDTNVGNSKSVGVWTPTLEYYSRYTAAELQPLVRKIALLVKNAPNAHLQAVYRKYESTKLQKISQSPVLYGDRLLFVLNDKAKV